MADIKKHGKRFTDSIVEERNRGNFYDLTRLKQIPITDVCQNMLGIALQHRHNGTWCKVRKESVPSVLIHTDKNTFYDFGTNTGGDVIAFVGYVLQLERKDAIRQLADAYHIEPVNPRTGFDSAELTDWEYSQIGLYGDLATKNFDFDMKRMPIERIYEISNTYSMPMNELKKKHPKTYERIIRQRALPYVQELRNNYFLHVWDRYQMAKAAGNPQLFYSGDLKASFADDLRDLTVAERILERAVKDTSIKLRETKGYDPVKDLERLSNGEIKPGLSQVGYAEIQAASKKAGYPIKYRTMDYSAYLNSGLENYFHSAFFKAGKVIVGYLDKDWKELQPLIEQKKPALSDKLRAAESVHAERKESRPARNQDPER